MECPQTNCKYNGSWSWKWVALQDKTSTFFGEVGTWLSKDAWVRLRKYDLRDGEEGLLSSSYPVIANPWYPLLVVCLPHAYLLCKCIFFPQCSGSSLNFISNQTFLSPIKHVQQLKSNPLAQSFLKEHHLLAPHFNPYLHSINCLPNLYWLWTD